MRRPADRARRASRRWTRSAIGWRVMGEEMQREQSGYTTDPLADGAPATPASTPWSTSTRRPSARGRSAVELKIAGDPHWYSDDLAERPDVLLHGRARPHRGEAPRSPGTARRSGARGCASTPTSPAPPVAAVDHDPARSGCSRSTARTSRATSRTCPRLSRRQPVARPPGGRPGRACEDCGHDDRPCSPVRRRVLRGLGRRFTEAELGPVLGVALGVLAHHVAVDRVALDEAAQARRLVGAVEQDAPRGPAAQPVPGELRGRVPDREPDGPARDGERLGLVDRESSTRRRSGTRRSAPRRIADREQPVVAALRVLPRGSRPRSTRWIVAGDAALAVVGEDGRPDEVGDVEILGQRVAVLRVVRGSGHVADATDRRACESRSTAGTSAGGRGIGQAARSLS